MSERRGKARRQEPAPVPEPTAEEAELGLPGEDRDRMLAAEADAAYRWAAAGVAGKHVLVAGCGRGHGAAILRDAGAATVVGADPDPRSAEIATRLYGERIHFAQAETTALPLAAGSFDAVVCLDAPTPELDPRDAIEELCRVLAPGGLLIVSLPLSSPPPEAAGPVVHIDDELERSLAESISSRFANSAGFRRRLAVAASVAPAGGPERAELDAAGWLAGGEAEDRSLLLAASDSELPELTSVASMVSFSDLRSQQETLAAWEERARRAEAEGSAKHWELVASREAQRRLRMRLHQIEHRPLRVIWRVLRGGPRKLGQGPPLRTSEVRSEHWD